MNSLDKHQELPKIGMLKRKAEYVVEVIVCIVIGVSLGMVMDNGPLSELSGIHGEGFYAIAIPSIIALWALQGALFQYRRDREKVAGLIEVGRSNAFFGWGLYMSSVPEMDDKLSKQGDLAERTIRRSMNERKGYLTMNRNVKDKVSAWLEMKPLSTIPPEKQVFIKKWFCWRLLRDNHCG